MKAVNISFKCRATASTNDINATVAEQLKFKASGVSKHVNDKLPQSGGGKVDYIIECFNFTHAQFMSSYMGAFLDACAPACGYGGKQFVFLITEAVKAAMLMRPVLHIKAQLY